MILVSEILAAKGAQVLHVRATDTVLVAIELMVHHNVGSVMVLDGDAPSGIFTERDHLRRVTLADRDPKTTVVGDVMTKSLICVDPEATLHECMTLMTRERIRHLPVIEDGRMSGMISIGDVVKHVTKEQEVEIRSLTEYITGRA